MDDYSWEKRNVASLWREGKTITVQMSHGTEKLVCVRDERDQEYFMFESFNYSVHKRLFNKTFPVFIKCRQNKDHKNRNGFELYDIGKFYTHGKKVELLMKVE